MYVMCTHTGKHSRPLTSLFPVFRLRSKKWMNVQVGDIIKLENNQFVTVSELVKNISSLCPFLFSTILTISSDFFVC